MTPDNSAPQPSDSFAVPAIDIAPFVVNRADDPQAQQDRNRVAREFDAACRDVGFVQVHGHGISEEVVHGLTDAMDAFFSGLSLDEKKLWRTPPGVNRGYAPPKSEATSLSLGIEPADRMNDFFEAFNVGIERSFYGDESLPEEPYQGNVWPDIPRFRAGVDAYLAEARRVAVTLTTVAEHALGLARGTFSDRATRATGTLRMNNYALTPGVTVDLDGELRGMGEHTDYDFITVLWADRVRGLQVLSTDGTWHDVSPDAGGLLVNLGDLAARWTNEHWMSTLHRVKPPLVDGTIERRRSAAYFHGFDWDSVVAPLPELLADGESALYEPIRSVDHTTQKLLGSRAGIANTSARRESSRVLSARD
ncbi:MAG: 2-oxoglutarate-dependent ethylene/succinate-forming enzyme [Actinomycetota bacterium]